MVSSLLILHALVALADAPPDRPLVEHAIEARIDPERGTLVVRDRLRLPEGQTEWPMLLHADMDPKVVAGAAEIIPEGRLDHLARYRLRVRDAGPVTLAYGGVIRHEREQITEGMGRAREWSRGSIGPDGVFLDGASGWYPRIPETLQSFRLEVTLPDGWSAVSQGAGPGDGGDAARSTWIETQPQDDIYLIAAPFRLYRATGDGFEAQVYLRAPDEALARRYLDATQTYVGLYADLIGDYPFAKFALVENFWETGYGMPSFTLLGPRVIRLPFIIQTSYPHEILHNWWGNSVYVDYESGNWAEGLTTYLADHLMRERAGEDWVYRRETLKGYADYVRDSRDFPIVEFRGRHGAASQAIGYGKTAMVFHMLRRELGDPTFTAGLQRFYADNRFSVAGFEDLRRAFETESGRDLGDFFAIWTQGTGAPRLRLADVEVVPTGGRHALSGRIEQTQGGTPFPLRVPVLVDLEEGDPVRLEVVLSGAEERFAVSLPSAPVRVVVDPWIDVFRALLPGETPVALSNLFGAERGLLVLPTAASPELKRGYEALATAWLSGHAGWEIRWDETLEALPSDRAVWLFGRENRWRDHFAALGQGFELAPDSGAPRIAGETIPAHEAISPVLTAWQGEQPIGWLGAGTAEALPGLARKLPHYGKYSYLVFTGDAPENILKGQWPSGDSDLVRWLAPRREIAPTPEPPGLVPPVTSPGVRPR